MKKILIIICSMFALQQSYAAPTQKFLEESGKFHYKYIKEIEETKKEQEEENKIRNQYYNICYEKMESDRNLYFFTKFKIFTCSCFAYEMTNFAYNAEQDSIDYFLESDENKKKVFDDFIQKCSIKFQQYKPTQPKGL